jgi:hypothetical protein
MTREDVTKLLNFILASADSVQRGVRYQDPRYMRWNEGVFSDKIIDYIRK